MPTTSEYRPTDDHELGCDLSKFCHDNRNHRCVDIRWLVGEAAKFRDVVYRVKNGDITPDDERAIRELRLSEIREEQDKIDDARRKLEREAYELAEKDAA